MRERLLDLCGGGGEGDLEWCLLAAALASSTLPRLGCLCPPPWDRLGGGGVGDVAMSRPTLLARSLPAGERDLDLEVDLILHEGNSQVQTLNFKV